MANPSTTIKAIRDVLLSQKFIQSTAPEAFDSEGGRLDRQFYMTGPVLVEEAAISNRIHQTWQLGVPKAFQPFDISDPERRRFDMADEVAALHEAWHEDTTINADAFRLVEESPVWFDEISAWVSVSLCEFMVTRVTTT